MVKLGLPLALALSLFLGVSDAQIKSMTLGGSLTSAGSIVDYFRCHAIVKGCNGKTHTAACNTTKDGCSSGSVHHSDGFNFKIEHCSSGKGVRLSINGSPLNDNKYLSLGPLECTNPTLNTFRIDCTWRNDIDIPSCY